jgi:serine/threonine-protein kinase
MQSPAPNTPREGDLVAGKYRVGRLLGAGGMGMVFAGRHEQLDQPVAIKVVRNGAIANEEGAQRFMREARAAARLKSEHVARVLDVGTLESGSPYMVMELLEGVDLAALLTSTGPLSVSDAADWVLQACEAIAEAHAAGIVHRDIKPENLFLARTVGGASHIKVLDFGISKSVDSMRAAGGLTRTQSVLGSPLYMSPEQMRSSRDVDPRTDVWALGVVLFELISGVSPFEADTMPELCLKVVSEPPRSLVELRPDVPAAMVEIVTRCLEKDPKKRFANAAEVAVALEPLVSAGARSLVERARLAMSRASGPHPYATPVSARSGLPDAPTPSTESTLPRPQTHNSWGAGTPPAPSPARRRSAWLVAAATAAVTLGLAAIFVGRTLRSRSQAPASPAPPAAVALAAPNASGSALLPVSLAGPTPSGPPSPAPAPVAPSATASASAAPSAVASAAPSSAPTRPVAATTTRPSPSRAPTKSAGSDDDIPTMR